jgi:adenosine deaminase
VHAGVHAHQAVSTFPVNLHINPITRLYPAQIRTIEVMHDIVTIVGVTRIHHGVVALVDGQNAMIARLAPTQWIKYGGRQQ